MTELSKLKMALGIKDDTQDDRLMLILEDASYTVEKITGHTDLLNHLSAVRAVAVFLYNKISREGLSSYSAGGVSLSFQDLPDAVKGMLPVPIASVAGRRFDHVEIQSLPE